MTNPVLLIDNYKHIIWDWNGTIIDDVVIGVDIINELLKQRKLETITVDVYKEIFTIPVKNYYANLGFDFTKEPFETVGKYWTNEYEKRKYECKILPGVVNLMEKISSIGIGQSILSAYVQHTLEEMVDYFDLRKYFTHIVGLDNIYAASKMHLGHELKNRLGNKQGECLIIGDTVHDYDVAKEIGADCVLVSSGHQSKNKLLAVTDHVIDSINELL